MTDALKPPAEFLDHCRDLGTSLSIRCGNCGRKFGVATPHATYPMIEIAGVAGGDGWDRAHSPNTPRRHMNLEVDDDGTMRLRCHKRCGGRWVVTPPALLAAFVRAARAARAELVLGDNL